MTILLTSDSGECPRRAKDKYVSWLRKYHSAHPRDQYGKMVKQAKVKDVSAMYNAVIAEMPSYVLRYTHDMPHHLFFLLKYLYTL